MMDQLPSTVLLWLGKPPHLPEQALYTLSPSLPISVHPPEEWFAWPSVDPAITSQQPRHLKPRPPHTPSAQPPNPGIFLNVFLQLLPDPTITTSPRHQTASNSNPTIHPPNNLTIRTTMFANLHTPTNRLRMPSVTFLRLHCHVYYTLLKHPARDLAVAAWLESWVVEEGWLEGGYCWHFGLCRGRDNGFDEVCEIRCEKGTKESIYRGMVAEN